MTVPLERPAHATELRAFAGVVPADPDAVFASLAARLADSVSDTAQRLVVQQGGWWYRAEYRVLPDDAGSRIEFEIVNVARPLHWAGPVAGRRELRNAPRQFAVLLGELHDELA